MKLRKDNDNQKIMLIKRESKVNKRSDPLEPLRIVFNIQQVGLLVPCFLCLLAVIEGLLYNYQITVRTVKRFLLYSLGTWSAVDLRDVSSLSFDMSLIKLQILRISYLSFLALRLGLKRRSLRSLERNYRSLVQNKPQRPISVKRIPLIKINDSCFYIL